MSISTKLQVFEKTIDQIQKCCLYVTANIESFKVLSNTHSLMQYTLKETILAKKLNLDKDFKESLLTIQSVHIC